MNVTSRCGPVILLTFLTLTCAPVSAQYFGQNKVRYKDMDFQVLKTEHFDIHYYPEEREATVLAGKMAERWYSRLSAVLRHELPANQPVILYDSGPAFRQTTVIEGEIGVGTGGVTEGLRRRVIMPFAGPLKETDHVLGHELVHAFQYDMTSGPGNATTGGVPGAATLPLWFIEGMAEYLSVGSVDPNTAMWLRDALERDKLPRWKDLDNPDYFPYRFGQAFFSYVAGIYGDLVVGDLLRAAGRAHSPGAAVQSVLKMDPEALVERWHSALRDEFGPILRQTLSPAEQANTVIAAKEGRNSLNVSPAVSPDGKRVAVFSERDIFSIDLFVINTETGEVERKLTKAAINAHLDSMEFIQSAGAWSADGMRFAYPTVENGWPNLVVYNYETGDTERKELRAVAEIQNLTWSPDGRQIAISAIAGGLMDLYVYDVDSEQLRRLTNDAFADFQPAWSPSGRYIAFATDRFGTNLDGLTYGNYRLALLDLQNNNISPLPGFQQGKHMDPHWGENDQILFFVSDQTGISNVYRLDRGAAAARQITQVRTGITGIAELSPAISYAPMSGSLLFTAFTNGTYSVFSMNGENAPERSSSLTFQQAATLPPLSRTENAIEQARALPRGQAPPASGFTTTNYTPSLSLAYVAPPTIGAGVGSYGAMVGGGTAFYFSDMLEQHQLVAAFQSIATTTGNVFRNLNFMGGYENRASRWTWGLIGGQTPYQTGGYSSAVGTIEGTPVIIEQNTNVWQIERQATGLLAYPFSRAMRAEFTTGYRNIGFAGQVETALYSPITGEFLGSTTTDLDTPSGLHMGAASAALVYDTSIFGGTSPVWGRRFRFEAAGQGGSLNFTTALADYRHYFRLPANFTLAVRGMHFGRYGGGAEDSRLQDLFLGYPALIRGYTAGSFTTTECGDALDTDGTCPAFDQLLGSKIAVGNAELRVPILGALGLIPSRGVPPVEVAPFFDAAYAWRQSERIPFFQSNSREPVRSYGGTMRANVLGFFVAQFSYVRPMDRPKGWHWEFAIVPGF